LDGSDVGRPRALLTLVDFVVDFRALGERRVWRLGMITGVSEKCTRSYDSVETMYGIVSSWTTQ
jgi:hypothetical protein